MRVSEWGGGGGGGDEFGTEGERKEYRVPFLDIYG